MFNFSLHRPQFFISFLNPNQVFQINLLLNTVEFNNYFYLISKFKFSISNLIQNQFSLISLHCIKNLRYNLLTSNDPKSIQTKFKSTLSTGNFLQPNNYRLDSYKLAKRMARSGGGAKEYKRIMMALG